MHEAGPADGGDGRETPPIPAHERKELVFKLCARLAEPDGKSEVFVIVTNLARLAPSSLQQPAQVLPQPAQTRDRAAYTAATVSPSSAATSPPGRSHTADCQNACQVVG